MSSKTVVVNGFSDHQQLIRSDSVCSAAEMLMVIKPWRK